MLPISRERYSANLIPGRCAAFGNGQVADYGRLRGPVYIL
jgi:hypothetical protein